MSFAIIAKGSLNIKNGNFICKEYGIKATEGVVNLENVSMTAPKRCIDCQGNATVNVDRDCVLTTTGNDVTAFIFCDGAENVATLNVAGTLANEFSGGNYAISGNGTDPGSPVININPGAHVSSVADSAIYQPENAIMTINGGKVEGLDGIYQKAGKIVVKGGSIVGTGNADYKYSGNGSNAIGNAVTVDFCSYPTGDPTLMINGGAFASESKKSVDAYMPMQKVAGSAAYTLADNKPELNAFIANNISVKGGTFNPEYDLVVPEAEEA